MKLLAGLYMTCMYQRWYRSTRAAPSWMWVDFDPKQSFRVPKWPPLVPMLACGASRGVLGEIECLGLGGTDYMAIKSGAWHHVPVQAKWVLSAVQVAILQRW